MVSLRPKGLTTSLPELRNSFLASLYVHDHLTIMWIDHSIMHLYRLIQWMTWCEKAVSCIYCIEEGSIALSIFVQWRQRSSITPSQSPARAFIVPWKHFFSPSIYCAINVSWPYCRLSLSPYRAVYRAIPLSCILFIVAADYLILAAVYH